MKAGGEMKTVKEIIGRLYCNGVLDTGYDWHVNQALSDLRELVFSLKHKPKVDGGGELQECECERCAVIAEVMELFK